MKKINIFLGLLVLVLVLNTGIGSAWAFFTTYAEARGGYPIHMENKTKIREEVSAWVKHLVITVQEGSEPVFVRAKAITGSSYPLEYEDASGKWTPGEDGFYYYSDMLNVGDSAAELQVKIKDVPKTATLGEEFNVVVVYESTPALFHQDGQPYADWNEILESHAEGGDN